MPVISRAVALRGAALLLLTACAGSTLDGGGADPGADAPPPVCVAPAGPAPDFLTRLGCASDFDLLASRPLDASIPGARSAKTVIDRSDAMALYVQNSNKYAIHQQFCVDHLSGHGHPVVGDLSTFNTTEYYSPDRRFMLGAVTRYDGPGVWTYEIAPYDTATADMVATAFRIVRDASFLGAELRFHPTSASVERLVKDLPADVPVVTSDDIFKGITYQPLNLGTAAGLLRFLRVADLEAQTAFVGPRDVVVLDRVPNDISAVAGLVTTEYQTPLSHVNVLAQNRGTPNMALKGATDDPALKALSGQWVRLTVGAFDFQVVAVSKDDADAWWESHKPPAVKVPSLDLSVVDLTDVGAIPFPDGIAAFGSKAAHFAELSRMDPAVVPVPKAFAIPVYWYRQFEHANGFDQELSALLADPAVQSDPATREARLAALRAHMEAGTLDPALVAAVKEKVGAEYPGQKLHFRSSTNAEDLDGFTGAGMYTSQPYDPAKPSKSIENAIRKAWASLWNFRAFEERSYRGIDQTAVAMALLVHRSFPAEDANGVALTANMFDEFEPGFWINVQKGGTSVVLPPAQTTTDEFLYFWYYPGQPMAFVAHSSLVGPGEAVLTAKQAYLLGGALDAIHQHFAKWYRHGGAFYAMDVEFKFNTDAGDPAPRLWIKQARPHAGWGGTGQ